MLTFALSFSLSAFLPTDHRAELCVGQGAQHGEEAAGYPDDQGHGHRPCIGSDVEQCKDSAEQDTATSIDKPKVIND